MTSRKKSKKLDLAAQLDAVLQSKSKGQELLPWCEKYITTEQGPFSLDAHRALLEIYTERHPDTAILKGVQIGLTLFGVALSLWIADQLDLNDIYYGPDDSWCSSFMQTRVRPIIAGSKYLQERATVTKNEGLIRVGPNRFVYYRGLFSSKGAISIPSHANIYDEVDFIPADNLELSTERLAASHLAWTMKFCRGMLAGAGIDKSYSESDQRKWLVRCQACNKDHVLEEEFPENIKASGDDVMLVCIHCGAQLDRQRGQWVASKPDRKEKRGYRISQLAIEHISLKKIWSDYQKVKDLPSAYARFSGATLAIIRAGSRQPITDKVLENAKRLKYHMLDGAPWSYCGIDVGDTCHIVLIDILPFGLYRVLHTETCLSEHVVQRYEWLSEKFHILAGVADAMPYKTEVKKIAARHRRNFWLRYYTGSAEIKEKPEGELENEQVLTINVDRNDSLDQTVDLLVAGKMIVPSDAHPQFEEHLKLLAKKERKTSQGDVILEYAKDVANDFGMALNNARLASQVSKIKVQNFIGLPPVFVDQTEMLK